LNLDSTGNWTYTLNNASSTVQALGQGATATDIITVASADGTTAQITITINGTDDAAVIGGATGVVTEDQVSSVGGQLTMTDIDGGPGAAFVTGSQAGTHGTFSL